MSLRERIMATWDTWRSYGRGPQGLLDLNDIYDLLWVWYAGEWHAQAVALAELRYSPQLYKNARQLWRQDNAVIGFYGQFVYQGGLPKDPKLMTDRSRCAIPIDPHTGSDATNEKLLRAIAAVWAMTNWRQHMSTRPRMGAVLGSGLTELVDDREHGLVMPQWVDPRFVDHDMLELDSRGHVKRYAVEYDVVVPEITTIGQRADRYRFRKEVDGGSFRYYREGKLAAYPELGVEQAEYENPYGFVPAIWDQHERPANGKRGISALEKQLGQILEVNSILSHALDYSRKAFATPIGVIGRQKTTNRIVTPQGAAVAPPTADEAAAERAALAERTNLMDMDPGGGFVSADFNIGSTRELLGLVIDSLGAERPEANYGKELLQMSQVTGPGADRILSPMSGLVHGARGQYDPGTESLHMMQIAMIGYRLGLGGYEDGGYPAELVAARPDRYQPLAGFTLDSYGQGLLDHEIPRRPVFGETDEERVNRILLIETLETEWGLREAGMPEDEIARLVAKRELAAERLAGMVGPQDDETGAQDGDEDDQAPRGQRAAPRAAGATQ